MNQSKSDHFLQYKTDRMLDLAQVKVQQHFNRFFRSYTLTKHTLRSYLGVIETNCKSTFVCFHFQ